MGLLTLLFYVTNTRLKIWSHSFICLVYSLRVLKPNTIIMKSMLNIIGMDRSGYEQLTSSSSLPDVETVQGIMNRKQLKLIWNSVSIDLYTGRSKRKWHISYADTLLHMGDTAKAYLLPNIVEYVLGNACNNTSYSLYLTWIKMLGFSPYRLLCL